MPRVAVDIVTGFLGSGKTSLLRHVLERGLSGHRVAVIVNEIGDIGIDALAAYREKRLTKSEYFRVMRSTKKSLAAVSIEDLSLRGNHLLLSIDREQQVARDTTGQPMVRVCNFELLKRK